MGTADAVSSVGVLDIGFLYEEHSGKIILGLLFDRLDLLSITNTIIVTRSLIVTK